MAGPVAAQTEFYSVSETGRRLLPWGAERTTGSPRVEGDPRSEPGDLALVTEAGPTHHCHWASPSSALTSRRRQHHARGLVMLAEELGQVGTGQLPARHMARGSAPPPTQ